MHILHGELYGTGGIVVLEDARKTGARRNDHLETVNAGPGWDRQRAGPDLRPELGLARWHLDRFVPAHRRRWRRLLPDGSFHWKESAVRPVVAERNTAVDRIAQTEPRLVHAVDPLDKSDEEAVAGRVQFSARHNDDSRGFPCTRRRRGRVSRRPARECTTRRRARHWRLGWHRHCRRRRKSRPPHKGRRREENTTKTPGWPRWDGADTKPREACRHIGRATRPAEGRVLPGAATDTGDDKRLGFDGRAARITTRIQFPLRWRIE